MAPIKKRKKERKKERKEEKRNTENSVTSGSINNSNHRLHNYRSDYRHRGKDSWRQWPHERILYLFVATVYIRVFIPHNNLTPPAPVTAGPNLHSEKPLTETALLWLKYKLVYSRYNKRTSLCCISATCFEWVRTDYNGEVERLRRTIYFILLCLSEIGPKN